MINYTLFMISPVVVELLLAVIFGRSVNDEKKTKIIYLVIMGVILALMIGLKSVKVGSNDAVIYIDNWEKLGKLPLSKLPHALKTIDIEEGYLITVWALSHIFRWKQFTFIFYGIFLAVSVCFFIYLNAEDVCLGFVMFSTLGLFAFLVQGQRQGIAIGICLLSVELVKRRRPILFILMILLAMSFHATAIVFFPVYFFPLFKFNILGFIVFGVVSIIALLSMDRIIELGNIVINDTYSSGKTKDSAGGIFTLLIYLLIIIAALLFADREKENLNIFFFMMICGTICFIMRFSLNTIMQRVTHYFSISSVVLASHVIMRFEKGQRLIYRYLIIILCLAFAFYKSGYSVIVPYTFFWQS